MRSSLVLPSLALAALFFSSCQQRSASGSAAPAEEIATRKIELHGENNQSVSLDPAASRTLESSAIGMPPALSTAPPTSTVVLPTAPKKPAVIDGPVVEDLGPCQGRGIAGSISVNGEKKPICGDGSLAYADGYNPYAANNSRNRNPYGTRMNSRRPYGGGNAYRYPYRP